MACKKLTRFYSFSGRFEAISRQCELPWSRLVRRRGSLPAKPSQKAVSGKRGSTDRQITDYNAKVGWNYSRYKLHSTVISLVLSSLEGQKVVLHVASFVRKSKAGARHWHGIVSCPDPLARFRRGGGGGGGSGDETRHGTP